MSDFLISLWESVFTPGPTPTLLRATNVTFGSLQVLLFVLLVATHSYHFLILSLLSGGLWWAINWFSAELLAIKEQEARASAKAAGGASGTDDVVGSSGKTCSGDGAVKTTTTTTASATSSGRRGLSRRKSPEQGAESDTETEHDENAAATGAAYRPAGLTKAERRKPLSPLAQAPSSSSSLDLKVPGSLQDSDLLKPTRSVGESSGYVSTDSEWEKVSENGGS